jgi:hypothetical protein
MQAVWYCCGVGEQVTDGEEIMSQSIKEEQEGLIADDGVVIGIALDVLLEKYKERLEQSKKLEGETYYSYWENRIASVERVLKGRKFFHLDQVR